MIKQGAKMKVAAYFNLHKNIFSLQSREKDNYGKVIGHVESVVIKSPKFVVRQAGREKVLKDKTKNVHAFVIGYVVDSVDTYNQEKPVTYNPYKYSTFVVKDTEQPIEQAEYAVLRLGLKNTPIIGAY
jgi:hypothetical protein